jgi:hypothetical protein
MESVPFFWETTDISVVVSLYTHREFALAAKSAAKMRHPNPPAGAVDFASAAFADRMTEEQADVAQLVEQLIRNQ